jgi:hypothetical protein
MKIPKGLCQCGCGGKTRLAPYTWAKKGMKKGEPIRFISGHQLRKFQGKVGKDHPNWKGGRSNAGHGYTNINQPDHPRAVYSNQVHEHILIAEKALGKPLPLKVIVHHHTPEQLVICQDQAYHLLLHVRTRALRACGHANWRKCRVCKNYDDVLNLNIIGTDIYHRNCLNAYRRSVYAKR